MSAVPIEPYQTKKLQASERDQQRGYSINHKQIVLAFAIEIVVVITSLIGTWLTASKYARTQAVLALIAALCLASPASAAEMRVLKPNSQGLTGIEITGDFVKGDLKKFEDLTNGADDYEKILVILNSQGGTAIAVGIADVIHKSGMSTLVRANEKCTSVCAFVWLAGARRYVYSSSHIGFHGVYNGRTGEVDHGAAIMDALIGAYLGHLGFDYDAIMWMLTPPVYSMHWLTNETSKKYGVNAEYFTTEDATAPPIATALSPPSQADIKYRVTWNSNLRSMPDGSGQNLLSRWAPEDFVPRGTIFVCHPDGPPCCIKNANGTSWCSVSYHHHNTDTSGWVSATFLEEVK